MFLFRLLVNALAVYLTAKLLDGVAIDGFLTAIVVSLVLGIVNVLVKPVLLLLTLPFNIFTFGLFTWVINALMILLVDSLVPEFRVLTFGWALLFSLVLSVISTILQNLVK